MKSMPSTALIFLLALLCCSPSTGQERVYTSARFNYQMTIPTGWSLSKTGYDVMLHSYKDTDALPQGLLPGGGAEIWVSPFSALRETGTGKKLNARVNTMEQWIQHELTTDHKNESITQVAASKDDNAPHNVVKVEADYQRDPQDDELQHEVNYYFTLNGHMFRLMLVYWKDNKNGLMIQSVFESVLRTMRSTN